MSEDMNEHTPLLPCPFCGGPAERHDFPADEADGNAGGSVIQCTRCMASSAVHFDRKENLVSDWNSRSPTLLARVRELEEVLNLILPLAKGYAAAHPVGSNVEYVAKAEAAIADR